MRRRLFPILATLCALLCIASIAIWIRSVRHFEIIDIRHNRWLHEDDFRGLYFSFSWYSAHWQSNPWFSSTLRLDVMYMHAYPDHFNKYYGSTGSWHRSDPPGWRFFFEGDQTTMSMNGYDDGFAFQPYHYRQSPAAIGSGLEIRTRGWLPPIVFALLPALWLIRRLRRRRARNLNLCPTCGYDLRATPNRCPECGTEIHPSTSPAASR